MIKYPLVFLAMMLAACTGALPDDTRAIEKQIRAQVLSEVANIASLEAIFLVTYNYFAGNYILADDIYIQKDKASLLYGFKIREENINIRNEEGKRILSVALPKGSRIAIDRSTISVQKTHKDYFPKQKIGWQTVNVDVDKEINDEMKELEAAYGEKNLQAAEENIRNFFRILAAKYGLELQLKIGS
jgi:hypothetical protein